MNTTLINPDGAVSTVRQNREAFVPEDSLTREEVAEQLFYLQMEIYSAHAGRDLYSFGDYDYLPASVKLGWLEAADEQIAKKNKMEGE